MEQEHSPDFCPASAFSYKAPASASRLGAMAFGTMLLTTLACAASAAEDRPVGGDVSGAQQSAGAGGVPSYYANEAGKKKTERDLESRRVDQYQDQYYKEQAEGALKRNQQMDREADRYYRRP